MKPGPFARRREAKKLEHELGTSLWRQAHDRFARSLDRYWQIIESGQHSQISKEEQNGLVHAGNVLVDCLGAVREICGLARQHFGEHELDIPPGANDVHRMISRAANDLAATAQAAAMFMRSQAEIESVGMRAEKVLESVDAAKAMLQQKKLE